MVLTWILHSALEGGEDAPLIHRKGSESKPSGSVAVSPSFLRTPLISLSLSLEIFQPLPCMPPSIIHRPRMQEAHRTINLAEPLLYGLIPNYILLKIIATPILHLSLLRSFHAYGLVLSALTR